MTGKSEISRICVVLRTHQGFTAALVQKTRGHKSALSRYSNISRDKVRAWKCNRTCKFASVVLIKNENPAITVTHMGLSSPLCNNTFSLSDVVCLPITVPWLRVIGETAFPSQFPMLHINALCQHRCHFAENNTAK